MLPRRQVRHALVAVTDAVRLDRPMSRAPHVRARPADRQRPARGVSAELVRGDGDAAAAVPGAGGERGRPTSAWSAAAIPGSRRRCTWPRRGFDVVLLEAQRVGWGASGRNGGQVGSGQRRDQDWLEAALRRRRGRGRSGTWPRRRRRWCGRWWRGTASPATCGRGSSHAACRAGEVAALSRRGGEARARLRLRRGRAARPGRDRGDARHAAPITAACSTGGRRICIR